MPMKQCHVGVLLPPPIRRHCREYEANTPAGGRSAAAVDAARHTPLNDTTPPRGNRILPPPYEDGEELRRVAR